MAREGQVIRRGERKFLVRWYQGTDSNGKRRYASKTIRGTKRDAEAALREIHRQRDAGIVVESKGVRLNEYLDRWLEEAAPKKRRERTVHHYREVLRRYVRPTVGEKRLDRLSVLEVQAMVNELEGRGLSAQTIRYAHAVLSAAMGQAVRWRLIQHNPCRDVEMPKRQQKEMRALTSEECGRLREAARGTRLEALWLLLLGTGMRPGEALGLRWDDLDLAKGQLRVRHSLVRTRGHAAGTAAGRLDAADARTGGPGTDPGRASADSVGGAVANAAAARRTWRLEEPKTAKSKRTIPLPPTVTRGLEAHKATQAEERLGLGSAYEAHGFVFATPFGQPLEQRNLVQRHFKPLLKNAELDSGIRLYDLRHTAATLMLASGAQVRGVADRMGHSSAKMTLDVYAHTQDGDDAQITSALEELCRG